MRAFASAAEARNFVMKYARDFWPTSLGRFPRSYAKLCEAFDEHDLWGSTDSRWELVKQEIDLPESRSLRRQ